MCQQAPVGVRVYAADSYGFGDSVTAECSSSGERRAPVQMRGAVMGAVAFVGD